MPLMVGFVMDHLLSGLLLKHEKEISQLFSEKKNFCLACRDIGYTRGTMKTVLFENTKIISTEDDND